MATTQSTYIKYRIRGKNETRFFDTDPAVCRPFGFYSGDRVLTSDKGEAWVVGVST